MKSLLIGFVVLTFVTAASASHSLVCLTKVIQGGHTDGILLEESLTRDGHAKLNKTIDNKVIEAFARNGTVINISIYDNVKKVKAVTESAALSVSASSSKLSVECGIQ